MHVYTVNICIPIMITMMTMIATKIMITITMIAMITTLIMINMISIVCKSISTRCFKL